MGVTGSKQTVEALGGLLLNEERQEIDYRERKTKTQQGGKLAKRGKQASGTTEKPGRINGRQREGEKKKAETWCGISQNWDLLECSPQNRVF